MEIEVRTACVVIDEVRKMGAAILERVDRPGTVLITWLGHEIQNLEFLRQFEIFHKIKSYQSWQTLSQLEATQLPFAGISVVKRPSPFDLIKNICEKVGSRIAKVTITERKEDTDFAAVFLEVGCELKKIDARPYDAISLALKFKAPIYVEDRMLQYFTKFE